MIEQNPVYDQMVDDVYEIAKSKRRGDLLSHDEIREVFGVEPNVGHWQHLMNRVRRRLENRRHISTISIREAGYKLCTIEEQISLGPWRLKRAARQVRRGERSLKALASVASLSPNQRHRQTATLAAMAQHRRSLFSEARTTSLLTKPSPTNPRRIPVAAAEAQLPA